jgi:diguanylate cyclase (GGDEF)-like protein
LQAEVSVYHERLSTTEARLRSEAGTADPAAISACLESLLAATAEYVRQQGPSQASLSAALSDDAVVQAECEAAIAALSHEQTQIQQARERLDSLDPRADVSAGHSALTGVAGKLFDANHRTRDALYGLQAGVQLSARGPEGLDDRLRLDALTGLLSRVGLEAALAEWWRKDPHRRRPLCLAMIDIDHFAAVNERWGQTGGNAVLQAIGEVLQNEQGGERVAARMLGQRFVVLMPDSDARSAVNWIERLRQAMETTRFVRRDEDLSLTVSCSVAQGIASDNPQSLMARAAAAVQQAKRYGRNRTFLSDGQFPTPVIPPNFPVETREIRI